MISINFSHITIEEFQIMRERERERERESMIVKTQIEKY